MTTSSRSVLPGIAIGRVEQADVPVGGGLDVARGQVAQRAVRGPLRREDRGVDDDVAGRQVDARRVRRDDRDQVVVGRAATERLEVVRAIDRRAVVDIVRTRGDDGPDLGVDEALELGGDALDRSARLDVAVEQVAGDQEQVDLLGEGEVDGRHEGGELALPLGGGLLTEVVVASAEMDVRGVDDP